MNHRPTQGHPAVEPTPGPDRRPSVAGTPGTVRILLFAGMAEAAGSRGLEFAWAGGTAAALRRRVAEELPAVAALLARSGLAIGDAYVVDDATIPAGAEVAIIPPVSGG